ncbi:MAG: ornithine cyclodeaminase family protein [Chloroherpetonaceae bacterium]|nr:ornithine cyclodeaminase family protein [Chthonomonadaceae bacterium]MDW8206283.1 ornithine cyclodeaminase family protein [Chloroherpetonaceae bacterium]
MAIFLTEQEVSRLLNLPEAIDALDAAFWRQAQGEVINQPRRRLHLPEGTYHTMIAADMELRTFAIKAYTSFRPATRFLVWLYNADNGDLLAVMEADTLGQVRTGAATGVAARYLALKSTGLRVGIFGTGWQAQSQLEAVCAVREVHEIVAYSRNEARRNTFCEQMTARLGVPVVPATAPEQAAQERDIVITATTSLTPVLRGEWLAPGAFVAAVGSNLLIKREIDEETVRRSALIVVDSVEQAKIEAGDLLPPYEKRLFRWEQVAELKDVVAGACPGRTGSDQIVLFKSTGLAMEDVAVATLVYYHAQQSGAGTPLPF